MGKLITTVIVSVAVHALAEDVVHLALQRLGVEQCPCGKATS